MQSPRFWSPAATTSTAEAVWLLSATMAGQAGSACRSLTDQRPDLPFAAAAGDLLESLPQSPHQRLHGVYQAASIEDEFEEVSGAGAHSWVGTSQRLVQ